ncbi:MAG: CBS domain-containing protein [Candidatus Methanoperedens sp.]|nr:CBS domain-containing protein [Candidatus Methanoperedens sp.]
MDVTPGDLKKIYSLALEHARKRMVSPKVGDIMTETVIKSGGESTLDEAVGLFREHHISGMPVVDRDNKVLGVITETDIISVLTGKPRSSLFDIMNVFHSKKQRSVLYVKDLMTSPAITVMPDSTVVEVADIFRKRGINRVPVVDEHNTLVGIVSRADIVKVYEKVRS